MSDAPLFTNCLETLLNRSGVLNKGLLSSSSPGAGAGTGALTTAPTESQSPQAIVRIPAVIVFCRCNGRRSNGFGVDLLHKLGQLPGGDGAKVIEL